MTLSLVLSITAFVAWVLLAFVAAIPAGWPHLFYAAAIMLAARRVIVGAPKFLS
jgi:hypothetical protein